MADTDIAWCVVQTLVDGLWKFTKNKIPFLSKPDHPRMHAFSYARSLPVK